MSEKLAKIRAKQSEKGVLLLTFKERKRLREISKKFRTLVEEFSNRKDITRQEFVSRAEKIGVILGDANLVWDIFLEPQKTTLHTPASPIGT